MNILNYRNLYLAIGSLAFAIFAMTINRTPLPWIDEVLWASASRSTSGVPTVLAAFSSGRFDLFYGPVGFKLGDLVFKLFGFSMTGFRSLSLLGAAMVAIGAGALVRNLGGTPTQAAFCFMLMALSPEIGQHATSGRLDTMTVGLELIGLVLYFSEDRKWWLAGPVWALAVLSTPRSLPFLAAFGLASLVIQGKTELRKLLTVSLIVLAAVTVWAATQGMTPFGWLKHIMEVSRGDKANASPLLGGEWSFGFALQNLITPIVVLALLPFVSLKEAKNKVAFITVAGSALLTLILISRPFNYGIFWILLFIPVLFIGSRRKLTYAMLGTLLSFYVGIRLIKTTEVISSWKSRNPEIVQGFVREHIPPGSIVYGSGSYFYYAVEHSKSSYRFPVEMTTPGLLSKAETAQNFEPGYLLWVDNEPLPEQFKVEPLARYEPKDEPSIFKQLNRFAGGYPAFTLYRASLKVTPPA